MSIKNHFIPFWILILQAVLTLIMLSQVFMYFFDHQALINSGIDIKGNPSLNLIYEMGARTLVMAAGSIYVLITQNPKQFLVVLFMNIIREGQEMIIDPLFPMLNAPVSPITDFIIHVIIVVVEIWAFMVVYKSFNKY